MSDQILHECGIAMIRLRKPLSYYIEKYGPMYAVNKMYILMEKQHNRGQDGAGIANIKLDVDSGRRYISRYRSIKTQPVGHLFSKIGKKYRTRCSGKSVDAVCAICASAIKPEPSRGSIQS